MKRILIVEDDALLNKTLAYIVWRWSMTWPFENDTSAIVKKQAKQSLMEQMRAVE